MIKPKPKLKLNLADKLEKIKGIGRKIAEEIAEEYTSEVKLLKDIKSDKFNVGGVSKKKIILIKKRLK